MAVVYASTVQVCSVVYKVTVKYAVRGGVLEGYCSSISNSFVNLTQCTVVCEITCEVIPIGSVVEKHCTTAGFCSVVYEFSVEYVIVCLVIEKDSSTIQCPIVPVNAFKPVVVSLIVNEYCSSTGVSCLVACEFSGEVIVHGFSTYKYCTTAS